MNKMEQHCVWIKENESEESHLRSCREITLIIKQETKDHKEKIIFSQQANVISNKNCKQQVVYFDQKMVSVHKGDRDFFKGNVCTFLQKFCAEI